MDGIKKPEQNQELKKANKRKKPYSKPTIQSDKVFEAQALACEKCDVGGPEYSCAGIFSS